MNKFLNIKLLLTAFAFFSTNATATANIKLLTNGNKLSQTNKAMPNMQNIKFQAIQIDCDGTSNIVIEQSQKYDLNLVVDKGGEQSVEVKDGVLHIACKRKAFFKSVNVSCAVKVPHDVEIVKISAGCSDITVRGYSGTLEIDSGTLKLSVNNELKKLSINAGTLNGEIYKVANHVEINSGTCDLKLYVEKTAEQKIDINIATGECAVYLPTGARVSYDTNGLIKCKSDFPNYVDLDSKHDVVIAMNSANGKLHLISNKK